MNISTIIVKIIIMFLCLWGIGLSFIPFINSDEYENFTYSYLWITMVASVASIVVVSLIINYFDSKNTQSRPLRITTNVLFGILCSLMFTFALLDLIDTKIYYDIFSIILALYSAAIAIMSILIIK